MGVVSDVRALDLISSDVDGLKPHPLCGRLLDARRQAQHADKGEMRRVCERKSNQLLVN
jgi:hypothetical protein